MLEDPLAAYRTHFRPSEHLSEPYVMVAAGVVAAETDEDALFHRSSQLLAFARLVTGKPGKLPRPVRDIEAQLPAPILAQVNAALSCSAAGAPATVKAQLDRIIDTHKPDELMVTGMIHDHEARLRSFEIAAEILSERTA